MMSLVLQSVFILSVIILSVIAPPKGQFYKTFYGRNLKIFVKS